MHTFADVVNRWETAVALAAELGISEIRVRQWRNRNSIPAEQWLRVVSAAKARGFDDVTVDLLAALAETRGEPVEPAAA